MLFQRLLSSWIYLCIGINTVVFLLWQSGSKQFMYKHFAISWQALLENRYWTLISSAFSHAEIWHFAINMYVLHSFGSILEKVLGRTQFWIFYLIAGVLGSLSHAVFSQFLMSKPQLPAIGASGAIAGLILVFSLMFPQQKILIFGIIPVPALIGALMFVAFDIWGLFSQSQGGSSIIGHGAHLGGAIAGALFYYLYLKQKYVV